MRKTASQETSTVARPVRLLIVEDDPYDIELCLRELKRGGFEIQAEIATTREELLGKLREEQFDLILADYRLPGWTGLDTLASVKELDLDIPVILVTGTLGESVAVECIRQGISDYVLKHQLARLPLAVYRTLGEKVLCQERARAQEALQQSEESFRLMFLNNPLPMYVLDQKTLNFLEVNEAMVRHYGYSRDEFLQMNAMQIRSEEEARRLAEFMKKDYRPMKSAGVWQHRTKDDRVIDMEIISHPLQFGGCEAMLVVAQDVTERRRAEEELRMSEERFRRLIQAAPEAIVVLDCDSGRFVDANKNAARLFGLTSEELLKVGLIEMSPPTQPNGRSSNEAASNFIREALGGGNPVFEWTHQKASGKDIPCEVRLVRLPARGKQLVRGSITDIAERKHAEQLLRESEARYRSLVENAPYGIYRIDLKGRVLDANPALISMLGYESAAHLPPGNWIEEVFRYPADHARFLEQARESWHANSEFEWKREDGRFITVRATGRLVKDNREVTEYFEMIAEDITERRTLEKQLLQAQKFEAIGQLAGGIAHDFNNMIGAIVGWADLGLEETPPESRLHRHFEKVRQQADRAAGLTRQLLAFARRQVLEPRDIDLNKAVTETLSLLEKVIGGDIEIKTSLAPDLAVVRADPTQIEQVLMNLCLNARDAMPEGGQLVIETVNVSFDQESCRVHAHAHPGRYDLLCVADTGTGMDAATLDRIFEPFFTTKEVGKGTGLGLAMVYGIVKQHGGFIYVYSEPGRGSAFRIYLPVGSAATAAEAHT